MTAQLAIAHIHRPVSDYGALLAEVQQERLLERSFVRYLPRFLTMAAMVAGGVVLFLWVGQSWWQLAIAAYFAVVFAQLGFLGHDAGHQQVFRSKRWNDRLGLLVSTLGVGLSYRWWVDKHTRHHISPNDVARDPDVQRNVLAWTVEQADRQRGPIRFIARHQAALFFPLLLLEAWNLHVGSVRTVLSRRRTMFVEGLLLTTHAVGCLGVLLIVLSPVKALAFVAVQHSLFGLYLGCSFAPNHKGMRITDGDGEPDFLRRQVLTARNIRGGRLMSALFGGLNYQIEHHLFPSMPTRNLRKVQPLVRRFCADRGVSYCETSLAGSYARVLRYLHSVRPAL